MPPDAGSHSRATAGVDIIVQAFDRWSEEFQRLTARARTRFEQRQWREGHAESVGRLALYEPAVARAVADLRALLGPPADARASWTAIKDEFFRAVDGRSDIELTLTFFSSVGRRYFGTVGVDADIEFLERPRPPISGESVLRRFHPAESTDALLRAVLEAHRFAVDYENIERDARLAAQRVDEALGGETIVELELAAPVFFRNKAAYLVGRLVTDRSARPFVVALLNDEARRGITVDAVLLAEADASIVFSYTRSYFSVDSDRPRELVSFLKSVLPRKSKWDLYIAIGHHKRAKTELYAALQKHLLLTKDSFEFAPGARGMVMIVFTMPSSEVVFKVLRDHFDYPKFISHAGVREKYQLVFEHDRAGRLVDAQEFTYLEFERARFSPDLLDGLQRHASQSVEVRSDTVVLRQVYTERRVVPLDIYVRQAPPEEAEQAVLDYGTAVRDLAATNIFPGDLLLKNFGVTRHGRVVFYDYDEICLLTDCRFRAFPEPRDEAEEFAAAPWFAVSEGDVFPQEFGSFLGLTGRLREAFLAQHAELLDPAFWNQMQQRLRAGAIMDTFPYSSDKRLLTDPSPSAAFSEVQSRHA